MKQRIKNFIKNKTIGFVKKVQQKQHTQIEQIAVTNQYRLMKKLLTPAEMPKMQDVGFRVYSQFEEDGMLVYIFAVIGTTNKRVVEICGGNGQECMATNLIINHGWYGLLFDGDKASVDMGKKFFAENEYTWLHPPIFKQAWLTRENIDGLIEEQGFKGEIDLLSLDIDGNDYYIMEAINVIKPRVIICEVQNVIPADKAITIPYISDFSKTEAAHPDFSSVSLLAITKLLNKKGYRLVGSHRFGFNVVFMLNEIGAEYFPEVSVESVLSDPYTKLRNESCWNEVKDLPWVTV